MESGHQIGGSRNWSPEWEWEKGVTGIWEIGTRLVEVEGGRWSGRREVVVCVHNLHICEPRSHL